jgi:hypothetical protein
VPGCWHVAMPRLRCRRRRSWARITTKCSGNCCSDVAGACVRVDRQAGPAGQRSAHVI